MNVRVGIVAIVVAGLVLLAWFGRQRGQLHESAEGGAPGQSSGLGSAAPAPSSAFANSTWDGGLLQRTVHDRSVRDEMRRRIFAAWSAEGDNNVQNAPDKPMPRGADGKIDEQYIGDVVRSDLRPLVGQCLGALAARKPGTSGRISLSFTIVGDDKIGGIVDKTELAEDAGALADDEEFATCIRESTMSLAFRPPGGDGQVVVPLTIVLPGSDH